MEWSENQSKKSELFRVLREEKELNIKEMWSAKSSATNCGSVMALSAISTWVILIMQFKFRNTLSKVLWLHP
jgi:hypothetical protein